MSAFDQQTIKGITPNPAHIKLKNDFRQYKKISNLKPFLDQQQALSVVGLKDGRFLACGISSLHMDDIDHCCLFRPAYTEFILPQRKEVEDDLSYYVINSQWKEMNGHGVFVTYEGLI
eukprot:scaffold49525_cov33-Attheya_sp.AAC.4